MLWILAFHLVFVITWFAGLFYLPRLYVYHTQATDPVSIDRFKIMERKLCYGIMTPSAVIATALGIWLITFNPTYYLQAGWLHAKLTLVILLWAYHIYLMILVRTFKHDRNKHGHVYYRWLNEVPVLFLIGIVILVVVKPF